MSDAGAGVVVLGLGNVLMSDDGAGVRVVQRLIGDPRLPRGVELIDGGTLGLELLSAAAACRRLVVVDAVDAGLPPGALTRLDKQALQRLPGAASVHQVGVADLLSAARLLGCEPAEVVLLGIQPERVSLGTSLSPSVEMALAAAVDAVVAEIGPAAPAGQVSGHA